MGKRLRDQWKQIRGDAKWWAITTVGGGVTTVITGLITTLVTIWGWVTELPGPYLVALALSIAALCVIIANGVRQWWVFRQWEQGKRPSPLSTELTTGIPKERFKTLSYSPLSLTGDQVAKLIKEIQPYNKLIKIKIVSSQEHLAFATTLAHAFRTAGYTFEIDPHRAEDIFLAKTNHDQLIVRYPQTDKSFVHLIAHSCIFSSACQVNPFPKESTIDYFQIEIGGAP